MTLDEAEIQLLASLRKAELEGLGADRASLERSGERYWTYLEDWSNAYGSLMEKGLMDRDGGAYRLTEIGHPLADAYHRERPDHYWYYYQHFYTVAHASAAHSRYCERVYGKDLCQEGQMDMAALHELLDRLALGPGDAVLDLGCGAGVISEYISDVTGATVTGVDYARTAIAAAVERTQSKRSRLKFLQGDLNILDLASEHYDAAIMIDSIYWVADMDEGISTIVRSLKRGGQLAIVIAQYLLEGDDPEILQIHKHPVAKALARLGLEFEAVDQTEAFIPFWQRIKESVVALRPDFEAEGNGFICDALEREADTEFLPAIRTDTLRRFSYYVSG